MNSRGKIAEYYESGLSLREIEKRVGVCKTKIRKTLSEDGIAIRNFKKGDEKSKYRRKVMRGGAIPFGFTYLENELVVEPREYKYVIEMHRLWQLGRSLRAIARTLNEQKVPTRNCKSWKHEVVKQIIDRYVNQLKERTKGP